MSAQPEHPGPADSMPPMRTLAELRATLARWGFPGDLTQFEAELDATDLDDLARVREIVQAYRHRVLLRCSADGMTQLFRPTADVTAELERKMAEAGRR